MKKSTPIKLIIAVSIVLLPAYYFRTEHNKLASITTLPSFRIISADSTISIDTRNISTGEPIIFMYFDPDCEHCQQETLDLLSNIDRLNRVRIYMLTNADNNQLQAFCKTFRTDTVSNIMVGKDCAYSFYKTFLPSIVPYIVIYNGNRNLVRAFQGQTNIRYLVNAISQK